MQKRHRFSIKQKRTKWGKILLAFIISFSATFGLLKGKLAGALSGDPSYWTATNSDLTLTVVNVSQNNRDLAPIWSDYVYNNDMNEFGNYYFQIANNTDAVTVDVTVEGMEPGQSYRIFDNQIITADDNGQVIQGEVKPNAYNIQESYTCPLGVTGQNCSYNPSAGEYTINISFYNTNGPGWISKQLVVRPSVVGSHNVEIISVKQGENDVVLDTEGWHVTSLDEMVYTYQTINEYQVNDYTTPVSLTYKLTDLEIGESYSVNIGNDYYSFIADASEKTETRELALDLADKHTSISIYRYDPGTYYNDEAVKLFFNIADENFVQLGDIIVDEIRQGGSPLVPTETTGWSREYEFTANDAQSLSVYLHTTRATADLDYYLAFSMYGETGGHMSSDAPIKISGEELENGTVLSVPAGFGLSDMSPFTLNISVNTIGSNSFSYGSQRIIYQNYAEEQNYSDSLKINYYEDENIPRFGASVFYSNGEMLESDVIDPQFHDAEHPLTVRIEGERYDNERNYEIYGKIRANGEEYYSQTFTATGAELNEGKNFVLEGLTLNLPVFDTSGDSTGYELVYEFGLEINDLEQRGNMLFAYSGSVSSTMTFAGGEVVAMGSGGGMGGSMYITSTGVTVGKSSLNAERGATLHYLSEGFEDNLDYEYAVYYNDNAGENWWSAPAGTKVEEGTLSGEYLNNNDLTVSIAVPSNEAKGVLYTLVISRNGGIVIVSRDSIIFTNEPSMDSFKFSADSDSFMQMGRTSYRVARGTDITATLKGSGFTDEEEYRVWVSYDGYRFVENENEGVSYTEQLDLSELDNSVLVTGAQLNAGYEYTLAYEDALDGTAFVEIVFNITDKDNERPDRYSQPGEGEYQGHGIYVEYTNAEDVFNGDGFQINEETGAIVDVSQPEEPGPGGVPVDIRTPGDVEIHTEGETTLVLVSDKPTLVIGVRGDDYELIEPTTTIDDDGVKTNSYDMDGYGEVKVVLKGDINMNGSLNARDSAKIDYYLLSADNPNHIELSPLELLIADINGSGSITARDASLLDYAMLSSDNPNHRDLTW